MHEMYKGFRIRIEQDFDPQNPRTEYDNLGKMVCFHGRYDLGDKGHGLRHDMFDSWDELHDYLIKEEGAVVILQIRMYDHSGIGLSTSASGYPFNCPWDSGWVGFIYMDRPKILEEYGWKKITKERREKLEQYLRNEVEVYSQYLSGDVWGYIIEAYIGPEEDREWADEDDDMWEDAFEHNSVWGFYGYDYCVQEAKMEIDAHLSYEARRQAQREAELANFRALEAVGV